MKYLQERSPSVYKRSMNPTQFKADFLRQVHGFDAFRRLLDLLPDVAFREGPAVCRIALNNLRGERLLRNGSGEGDDRETRLEFFSEKRRARHLDRDRQVVKSGRPLINAVCPAPEKVVNALIGFCKVGSIRIESQVEGESY